MTEILRETENPIWDFPTITEVDRSVTKLDYLKVYEDHHGAGSLQNADNFSFTTDNEDLWLLPGKSYLKINFYLRKLDSTPYLWDNRAAVQEIPAQGGNPAVPAVAAVDADDINLSDNAYNLFEEARYYINDQEVERIDHVGISTLINQILQTNSTDKQSAIKHTQLLFFDEDTKRQTYMRKRRGHLHVLLPISKIFPFCKTNDHVFRGVKHRITLTKNDINRLLKKSPAVANGKIFIENMTWVVPYVEPSLGVMSSLETQLATSSEFKLNWEAVNTFKEQPALNREVRLSLAATVHKPTKLYVALQNLNRYNSLLAHSMTFDNLNLEEIYAEVNSVRFPEKPMEFSFGDDDYTEVYNRFLEQCKSGQSPIDFEKFKEKYSIIPIDVSKHQPELFENSNFPIINIYLKFSQAPTEQYIAWVIVCNEREATLNIDNRKMRVIR